jgi:hypothetical protein
MSSFSSFRFILYSVGLRVSSPARALAREEAGRRFAPGWSITSLVDHLR